MVRTLKSERCPSKTIQYGNSLVICPKPQRVSSPRDNSDSKNDWSLSSPQENASQVCENSLFGLSSPSRRSLSLSPYMDRSFGMSSPSHSSSHESYSYMWDDVSPRSGPEIAPVLKCANTVPLIFCPNDKKKAQEIMRIMAQTDVLNALKTRDQRKLRGDEGKYYEKHESNEDKHKDLSLLIEYPDMEYSLEGSCPPPQRPTNPFDNSQVSALTLDDDDDDSEEEFVLDPLVIPPSRPWSIR